ncbi:PREDICTED: DNA polymerase delta subunit 3-like [Priapulus caudatus]|uniref:DNA polymerase delta subunit 3 n=1 Tax=Priapulus caudatus TaxID=37621 RepID=A0ABM1EAZ3_PRICU|nr:PREDICTED: DNA polymerase delta subunit 3-like [Priapulus caudatus]
MSQDNQIWLENLDEWVNDQHKIVTYKWLSRRLNVHVNQAKQMLYTFVQHERNTKHNDNLEVIYMVSGLAKSQTGEIRVQKVVITPEEQLDLVESSVDHVNGVHMFSVQKSKLKDLNTLYLVDYNEKKKSIYESEKHSAISCIAARQKLDVPTPEQPQSVQGQAPVSKQTEQNGTHQARQSTVKSSHQKNAAKKGIVSMFANHKAASKDTGKKDDIKKEDEQEGKQKLVQAEKGSQKNVNGQKKDKAKIGNLMACFGKQAAKAAEKQSANGTNEKQQDPCIKETKKPTEAPKKKEEIAMTASKVDKQKQAKDDARTAKREDTKKMNTKRKTASKKKGRSSEDEEEPVAKKKRRRIRAAFSDSSSSEDEAMQEEPQLDFEEDIEEPDSPVKLSLPATESSDEMIPDTPQPTAPSGGSKRRIHKRKLVSKTVVDDDGFMVTEKVWESSSEEEDASVEPPEKKVCKTKEEKSPAKTQKSPTKTKQPSVMSFFKKK